MAQTRGSLLGLQGEQCLPCPGSSILAGGFGHPGLKEFGPPGLRGAGGTARACSVGSREEHRVGAE